MKSGFVHSFGWSDRTSSQSDISGAEPLRRLATMSDVAVRLEQSKSYCAARISILTNDAELLISRSIVLVSKQRALLRARHKLLEHRRELLSARREELRVLKELLPRCAVPGSRAPADDPTQGLPVRALSERECLA